MPNKPPIENHSTMWYNIVSVGLKNGNIKKYKKHIC